ncbi:MAG: PQ-loop repeat-containing protein [Epsilonproteobacteria bacterium]|nr:PQ-loop repeat-containing protein [Campylobacterota bacterium]
MILTALYNIGYTFSHVWIPFLKQFITNYCIWICWAFYVACFFPQITTNLKLRSAAGLCDFFLLGLFNGYWTTLYFVFGCGLPTAYKVFVPLGLLAITTMIAQRLYFDWAAIESSKRRLYGLSFLCPILFLPAMYQSPYQWGMIIGWVNVIVASVNQIPQVVKIFRTRSVSGFSLGFVLITGIAACIELSTALFLELPVQSMLCGLRGIAVCLIFCLQFALFRKNTSC